MLRDIRINLLIITAILICIGTVMIFSASSVYAWERYNDGFFFLKRHIIFIIIGIFLTFLVMGIDYRNFRRWAKPALALSILLLILVLIPGIGKEVAGARRWFRFKFISFQPSELANIAMVIYIADFIARKGSLIRTFWHGFLPTVLVLGTCVLLILIQPDLGTALALAIVIFIMLYVSGARLSHLLSLVLISLPLFCLLIFSVPYRRMRIMAFLNPWLDPKGSGFQIIQSQIALGSGGIFGIGLGHSRQKLFYLPAAHTDFIFSVIGEELGLVGTGGIIILFMIFIHLCLKIIKNTPDKFSYFLSLGLTLMISLRVIINIGVACGILPTKGLPLPFISYGGSFFIFDMISVGMLINMGRTEGYI